MLVNYFSGKRETQGSQNTCAIPFLVCLWSFFGDFSYLRLGSRLGLARHVLTDDSRRLVSFRSFHFVRLFAGYGGWRGGGFVPCFLIWVYLLAVNISEQL